MDHRHYRDDRYLRTNRQRHISEEYTSTEEYSTSYESAHGGVSWEKSTSPSPALARTSPSPFHLDCHPKTWLERIPKGKMSAKKMTESSGKSSPEETRSYPTKTAEIALNKTKKSVTPAAPSNAERIASSAAPADRTLLDLPQPSAYTLAQPKKRSVSATEHDETEESRPAKSQKVGDTRMAVQKEKSSIAISTEVTVPSASKPATLIVRSQAKPIPMVPMNQNTKKADPKKIFLSTKQSAQPSTKPGPLPPPETKQPPTTTAEALQNLAILATEDDGDLGIKPETLIKLEPNSTTSSSSSAHAPPLPKSNTNTIGAPTKPPTNPTTANLTAKIAAMHTDLAAAKAHHLVDVAMIKQVKAEKVVLKQEGKKEKVVLKQEGKKELAGVRGEKNAEIARLREENKDLRSEKRAVEKRCAMLKNPVFSGLLKEFMDCVKVKVEGGVEGLRENKEVAVGKGKGEGKVEGWSTLFSW